MSRHAENPTSDVSTEPTAADETTPVGAQPLSAREGATAHDRFGGLNLGASVFGWLVALSVAALLTGVIGAVVAAVSDSTNVTQSQADRQAGTIGVTAAVVLVVVLMLGYYAGGYVAGRMSRFDGGRQGFGVWLVSLVVTIVVVAIGAVAGTQYNVFDRVDLPNIPIAGNDLTWGAVVTAVVVLLATLLAAVLGGVVGRHYHQRVDRAMSRDLPPTVS